MSNPETESSLKKLANGLFEKYSERLPVIINRDPSSDLPIIEKKKYMIPHNMTIGSLILTVRQKISIPDYKTLYLVTAEGNYVPSSTETMAELYQKYRSDDNFLHFNYKGEDGYG